MLDVKVKLLNRFNSHAYSAKYRPVSQTSLGWVAELLLSSHWQKRPFWNTLQCTLRAKFKYEHSKSVWEFWNESSDLLLFWAKYLERHQSHFSSLELQLLRQNSFKMVREKK